MIQDFFPIFGVIKNTVLSLTLGYYQEEADEYSLILDEVLHISRIFCSRIAVKWFCFHQCKYAPTDYILYF